MKILLSGCISSWKNDYFSLELKKKKENRSNSSWEKWLLSLKNMCKEKQAQSFTIAFTFNEQEIS